MYKIRVRAIDGVVLTFTVEQYAVDQNGFVCFIDRITKKSKMFHSSNCEIEVVSNV